MGGDGPVRILPHAPRGAVGGMGWPAGARLRRYWGNPDQRAVELTSVRARYNSAICAAGEQGRGTMVAIEEGTLLWQPSEEQIARSNLTQYQRWLERTRGLRFDSYDDLWRWSVTDLEAFWA